MGRPIKAEKIILIFSLLTAYPFVFQTLLQLLSHTKTVIKEQSLIVLVNLIPVDIFRVAVGNAEGIKILIEESKDQTSVALPTFLHCLCCCCRDSVNRLKVKELDGLNLLLDILKSDSEACRSQHETVLSALLNFYYDEPSLKYLASLGFIRVLVKQLLISISPTETQTNQCIKNYSMLAGSGPKQCNRKTDTPKLDKSKDSTLSKPIPNLCIPTQDQSDYSLGLSPETRHCPSTPGSSVAISPPHMDWSAFMSGRPRLVAPDVSPLSSASSQSISTPRVSPQWSPQWSPSWSPQWSPDYSPTWEPMWSPQSSPEHSVEVFEMEEETNRTGEAVADDATQSSEVCSNQHGVGKIDVEMKIESEANVARYIASTSSECIVDNMESASAQITTGITGQEHMGASFEDTGIHQKPSTSGMPIDETFKTPDSSRLKSRSYGKRKGKHQNIAIKSAKCIEFTPADLPLESAMSSPSHSSTCTSVGEPETTPLHKGREHDTLCMLSRYSHMDKPSKHLMDSQVITGLLDYWVRSPNPHSRCWRVLVRLVDNRHCFERMLLEMIPMTIYEKLYSSKRKQDVMKQREVDDEGRLKSKLPESKITEILHSDVDMENVNSLLYRLASMAASHFGEGVMEHLLLVDHVMSQVPCVLAMPYLCR